MSRTRKRLGWWSAISGLVSAAWPFVDDFWNWVDRTIFWLSGSAANDAKETGKALSSHLSPMIDGAVEIGLICLGAPLLVVGLILLFGGKQERTSADDLGNDDSSPHPGSQARPEVEFKFDRKVHRMKTRAGVKWCVGLTSKNGVKVPGVSVRVDSLEPVGRDKRGREHAKNVKDYTLCPTLKDDPKSSNDVPIDPRFDLGIRDPVMVSVVHMWGPDDDERFYMLITDGEYVAEDGQFRRHDRARIPPGRYRVTLGAYCETGRLAQARFEFNQTATGPRFKRIDEPHDTGPPSSKGKA